MPGLGLKSYVQFAKEAIFGTQPTYISHPKLEIISENLTPQIGAIRDPSLSNNPSLRSLYEAGKLYRGTIVMRGSYDGMLELLRATVGTYSSAIVEADLVWDHTYKEIASPFSYSVEIIAGDVPTGKCFRLSGAKITSLTFRMTAGQGTDAMGQIEIGLIATDMQSDQTITTKCVADRTTCTIAGATTITHASSFWTYGVRIGMVPVHANIPAGTYITAISSNGLTLTLNQACTNGSALTIAFGPGFPFLMPVLFHHATHVDDGTTDGGPTLVASIAGTISGTTTFTRSAGSFATDGVVIGYLMTGAGLSTTTATTVASVTPPTVLTFTPAGTNGAATLSFANPLRVRSLEMTLDNPVDDGRFYLGSRNVDEAVRNDFLSCRWRITVEFASKTAFDMARTWPATAPSPRFIFKHPTTIGSGSVREFEIRAGSASFVEWSAPVESYGIVTSTMTLDSFFDPTDATTILVRVRNIENPLP